MSPTVLRSARPIARKSHRCALCGARINPGEQYSQQTNVYDGRVYDWRNCGACAPVCSAVAEWVTDFSEGYGPDEAEEWARDNRDDPIAVAYLERLEAFWAELAARRAAQLDANPQPSEVRP